MNEMIDSALRILYLSGGPVVLATVLAGLLVSGLQAAMGLQESSLTFAAKLAALVAVLYFILPGMVLQLRALAEMSLQ